MQFTRLFATSTIVVGCVFSSVEAVPITITKPPPTVTLLDAGQEPRKELRLKFVEGATQQSIMTITMSQTATVDEEETPSQVIPPIIQTMEIHIDSVELDGSAKISLEILEAHADAQAKGVDPVLVGLLNDAYADIAGLFVTSHVTPRGIYTSTTFELPENTPPGYEQIIQSMSQSLDQMSNPFPIEPVGVGAIWRVVSVVELGAPLVVKREFELVAIDGDTITLRTTGDVQLIHDKAPADIPELPEGMSMTFDSIFGSVTGSATQNLHELMPRSAKGSQQTTIVSTMTFDDEEIKSNIQTNLVLEIATPTPIGNE